MWWIIGIVLFCLFPVQFLMGVGFILVLLVVGSVFIVLGVPLLETMFNGFMKGWNEGRSEKTTSLIIDNSDVIVAFLQNTWV